MKFLSVVGKMQNIKVSHVIRFNETNSSLPFSGAENHLLFLLPALVVEGVSVELIAIVQNSGPVLHSGLDGIKAAGVKVIVLPLAEKKKWYLPGYLAIRRTWDLYKVLQKRRKRIIHLHLDFFGAPIAAWLAKCHNIVMTIHNDAEYLSTPWMRIWLYSIGFIIKRFIAISDRVKKYFSQVASINPIKIDRIYHGIDVKIDLSPKAIRTKYNIPINKFVVGFVGRLTYEKNVDTLIKAAKHVPNLHFVVVGNGELRGELHELAKGQKNIQFIENQLKGYEFISCFDLFCLPSRSEGLGIVLLEAMLLGTPIVASRAGAIPEILANGKYGYLFEVGDIDQLVSTIGFILTNQNEVSFKTLEAKEYAQNTFTIKKMVENTIIFYGTVLQSQN